MQVETTAPENIMSKTTVPKTQTRSEPAIAIKENENIINKAIKRRSRGVRVNSGKEKEIKNLHK